MDLHLMEFGEDLENQMESTDTAKTPVDNGGRRIPDVDRRAYAYTVHIPERRKGGDRRSGEDRRKH